MPRMRPVHGSLSFAAGPASPPGLRRRRRPPPAFLQPAEAEPHEAHHELDRLLRVPFAAAPPAIARARATLPMIIRASCSSCGRSRPCRCSGGSCSISWASAAVACSPSSRWRAAIAGSLTDRTSEPERVRLIAHPLERRPDRRLEAVNARGAGLRAHLHHAGERVAHHFVEQLQVQIFLAAEVLVDQCLRDAGGGRDVVRAHVLVAPLAEHLERRGQDAGASLDACQAPARRAVVPHGTVVQEPPFQAGSERFDPRYLVSQVTGSLSGGLLLSWREV